MSDTGVRELFEAFELFSGFGVLSLSRLVICVKIAVPFSLLRRHFHERFQAVMLLMLLHLHPLSTPILTYYIPLISVLDVADKVRLGNRGLAVGMCAVLPQEGAVLLVEFDVLQLADKIAPMDLVATAD